MKTLRFLLAMALPLVLLPLCARAETLGDYIPGARDFAFLEKLAVDHVDAGKDGVTVHVSLDGKPLEFSQTAGKKGLSFSARARGAGVRVSDFLQELKGFPGDGAILLDDIVFHERTLVMEADGSAEGETFSLVVDARAATVQVTARGGATLGRVLPALKDVPGVDLLTFETLTLTPRRKSLAATGRIGATEGTLTLDLGKGLSGAQAVLTPTKGKLGVGDMFPKLRNVPVIDACALTALRYDRADKAAVADGRIGDKAVALSLSGGDDAALALTAPQEIGLANALPVLKGVPGIGAFGFKGAAVQGKTLSADLVLGSDPARLEIDLGAIASGAKTLALRIVPDGKTLTVGGLFPDLSGLPGVKDLVLTGLDFAEKTGDLVAALRIGGSGGKSGKSARLNASLIPGKGWGFVLSGADLVLGDVVPALAGLPGLDALAFEALTVSKAGLEASAKVGGSAVKLFADPLKGFAALDFGGLDAAAFIPGAGKTALNGLRLASSVFVFSGKGGGNSGDLPLDMRKGFTGAAKAFKAGVNLLGAIRKQDLGPKLASAFDKLAVSAQSFPVSGVLPDQVLDVVKGGAKEAGSAILDALDITVDIPLPAPAALKRFVTFETAQLSISGNAGSDAFWKNLPADMQTRKPSGRLDVSLRGGVRLALAGEKQPLRMETLVDLNAGEAGKSMSLLGLVSGSWNRPLGLAGLTLEKSGFDIALATGGTGKASSSLSFFADAKLHGKTDLGLAASFTEAGGLPKLNYFVLDGPLALSDLAGELPHGSDFIVREIKLYPDGVEAQVESKSKLLDARTNLYLFEVDAPKGRGVVAAIDLGFNAETGKKQTFSLGKLASVAGLKGPKASLVQGHLNAMAVANAALVLSSEQISPLPPEMLSGGIAKDLFTGIFGASKVPVKLDNVTFLSDFRADLMGDIGDKLTHGVKGVKIGLSEDAVINGAIGGLFDGDPLSLDLEFLMAQSLSLDNLRKNGLKLPAFIKAKPAKMGGAEKIGVFLKVVDATFEAGLLAGFDVQYNDTAFDFTGTLGVQLAEEEIGLSLSGAMSDTWKNALGIKGFELENVAVSGEVQPDPPSIKFGLGGEANLWGHDMTTAGDLTVGLLGEVPVPEGLGVKTAYSQLDVTMYEILNTAELAETAAGFAVAPEMWPLLLAGAVAEVGLSEGYTVIYDKTHGKAVTAGDLAKAPVKDAALLIKDYSKLQAWLLGGKNIYLSFATPGASDANLGIPDGIRFSGQVELFGGAIKTPSLQPNIGWIYRIAQSLDAAGGKAKHAASGAGHAAETFTADEFRDFKKKMNLLRDIIAKEAGLTKKEISAAYPKPSKQEIADFLAGLKFTQKQPFRLGGLEFTDSRISLVPFHVNATTKLFGAQEAVELSLQGGKLVLAANTSLGILGKTDVVMEFDPEAEDFILVGRYENNPKLQSWMTDEIRNGIRQIGSTASGKLEALDKDLAAAQKARDTAEHGLTAAQNAVSRVSQGAVDRLRETTSGYERSYDSANRNYNSCHGWKKAYCEAKWWPRKQLAWETWQASKQLLSDAEAALSQAKSLAVEVHKAEIKLTDAATSLALVAKDVAAATDIRNIVADGLKSFADSGPKMSQLFHLDEALVAGSAKDVAQGKPLVMELRFTLNGKKYREFFALSPADAAFNALSFGLLPVIAAEHVVADMETRLERKLGGAGNLAGKLTTWINAHIYELVGGLHDNLEKKLGTISLELSEEESRYKKVLDSVDAHAAAFQGGYADLTDQSNRILSTYKMTDFMAASGVFANRYLAVGHSLLCLGVADNGIDVYQQNCKDIDAERWTAAPLAAQQTGYVQLKSKGLCLKARDTGGKSGQPLILAQCTGADDGEKWKFLSQDGIYSKFVNRASQKCLHFDTENANAKAGYAVWTSCFGADSETFRVLTDAEKPVFHPVGKEIRAHNGACLAIDPDFPRYFSATARGKATATHGQFLNMQRVRDNALYAGACAGVSAFNYVETPDGRMKLVHADSGWCAVPGPRGGPAVLLLPCDNEPGMFWKVHENAENAFVLQNAGSNGCLDLGTFRGRAAKPAFAAMASCRSQPSQQLEFVKN